MFRGPTTLYRLYDRDWNLLYIGVTNNPTGRFTGHACEKLWWHDIATIGLEHYDTRREALQAEADAIRYENPRHNLAGTSSNLGGFSPWSLPRALCSSCDETHAVAPNGCIWRHKTSRLLSTGATEYGTCRGSGRRPRESVA